MAQKLIYQDEPTVPKRRRRKKTRAPRALNSESRDVKLLRLPFRQMITLTEASTIMGIERKSLQANYLYGRGYLLPDFIELVRDAGHIVGIRRIGP